MTREEFDKEYSAGRRDFNGEKFAGVSFKSAVLKTAVFTSANFTGAEFLAAYCSGADFRGADFYSANFRLANCHSADFRGAECYRVDFRDANCYAADFRGAKCYQVDFRGADCSNARFVYANLTGANFAGAKNLETADFTAAILDGAVGVPENKSREKWIRPTDNVPTKDDYVLCHDDVGYFVGKYYPDADCWAATCSHLNLTITPIREPKGWMSIPTPNGGEE